MALTRTEIDAVVRELTPVLSGGWVQKVFQPAPLVITLEVRARGKTHHLLISADQDTGRIHLLSQRLGNPPKPPAFCQYMRCHVQGCRVDAVEQLGRDRIVRFRLTTKAGPRSLIAALTGRSTDLLLLNHDGTILKSLRDDAKKIGQPYVPPVSSRLADIDSVAESSPRYDQDDPFPVSRDIERRCQEREEELARRRAKQTALATIRKAIKRAGRRVDTLRLDLDKASRYQGYDRYGELIKANLGRISKGTDRMTVVDYFDPGLPELVIPLDPSKTPQGNMEDYFKKYRKAVSAEREIRPRLKQAEATLADLVQKRRAIDAGTLQITSTPAVASRESPASSRAVSGQARSRKNLARSGPFRRFSSSDGLPIYVGRNARENEELTHRFARGDDLWLHARGVPGSHVVVRLERGAAVPPETLRDAATLALLYSDLKRSGKGEVMYTRKKWVKKAKGHPPGTVTVTQEKGMFVTLEKRRLEALKARSQ
jgi:predicted ribosome quality control (RQC) complex YloA/Tae2 family protein